MLLAVLLRPLVALALASAPVAPVGRDYAGASAAEVDDAASQVPAVSAEPRDTGAEPPAIVPVPEVEVPPMDASAPAGEGEHVTAPAPALPRPVESVAEGPAEEDDADLAPYDPMIDSPEAIRARHWIRSGIVFLALGGVLGIGALAMSQAKVNDPGTGNMPCNVRSDPAGNGCTAGGRTRAALALGVPALALLGGGAAMLAVGKRQQKRLAASLHADRRGFFLGVALQF